MRCSLRQGIASCARTAQIANAKTFRLRNTNLMRESVSSPIRLSLGAIPRHWLVATQRLGALSATA